MKPHWTELLAVDRFCVRTSAQLGDREHKTLNLLYQPLTGVTASALYLTLWSKLEKDSYWSEESTHHELMASLSLPLDDIFEARKVLEGIGLLRTFQRTEEKTTLFVYELQPPLSPAQFFQDDVLSVYLFNKLGSKERYRMLRSRFLIEAIDKRVYSEVTASFNEVFSSLHYTEMMANDVVESRENTQELVGDTRTQGVTFSENTFDFSLLKADLPVFIDSDKLLNEASRSLIRRLAFVYRVGPLEMSPLIQQSLLGDDKINEEELRRRVQEWYRFEYGKEPPALGLRKPEKRPVKPQEPVDETEAMRMFYEQTSPLTFLKSRADGAQVPLADVKLVESLIFDYKLEPGVVNVLIDYVMETNNLKLNRNLVQKIAGHWTRKKIQTVAEAMELAKKEYQGQKNRQQHSGSSNQGATAFQTRPPYVRKDKLPKWLESENEKKDKDKDKKAPQEDRYAAELQEFEEMLKLRNSLRQK
ncbi:replication initiation and membrane attachment family protein [Bacillus piscicola]|uniref:replication initiation and membrane attachment family protein n=1 Tax=Bacillus piscicola TaxID=1632684 RepID=UPI001F09F370|nr:DnaD domain protein [Bacillus piscicola]